MESKKSLPMRLLFLLCLVGLSVSESHCSGNLTVHPGTIKVLKGSKGLFNVTLCHNNTGSVVIHFQSSAEDVLTVEDNITIPQGEVGQPYPVEFHAKDAGITNIQMSSTQVDVSSEFVLVSSMENEALDTIAVIIGWIYFVAWSVSFYPQVYLNFRRRSVVGLSFDFLSYNFTGFLAYGIFNVGLYWIDEIKEEYTKQHKYSVIPVQLNDVVFTIHAFFITCVTIFQTFIYERGGQKVTTVCWILQSIAWMFVTVTLIITAVSSQSVLTWLEFVTFISYIKLGVTLIKYVPQVWMNFKRKSTDGWSIGNVLLDFTGGSYSILQMILISYNYNDWSSFFLDPTKFGLGLFSICFDIVFILQHYVWYKEQEPPGTENNDQEHLINSDAKDQ
ncbi:putative cystinosin-like [Apostichopus japonicus]|uniref:Cystinosin homolog n=1 Tax=Stichopus japonicus TaxID=307972 RepID=A0A2G8L6Z4_STIJA|nr:putative cystinosin-like [Apostichopus japonicus]